MDLHFVCISPNFRHEIKVSGFHLPHKHSVWGTLGQQREKEQMGEKNHPIAFLQEFQRVGACCGFSSSPCLHYTSF